MPDPIAEICDELFLLKARQLDVGPTDAIGVRDDGNGRATLQGSVKRLPFYWYGDTAQLLERLRGLPDGGGRRRSRSEFS